MKFTKYQIALQIFPDQIDNPNNAVQHMRRWIRGDPELSNKLKKVKYNPKNKCITKRQAELILRYLG